MPVYNFIIIARSFVAGQDRVGQKQRLGPLKARDLAEATQFIEIIKAELLSELRENYPKGMIGFEYVTDQGCFYTVSPEWLEKTEVSWEYLSGFLGDARCDGEINLSMLASG